MEHQKRCHSIEELQEQISLGRDSCRKLVYSGEIQSIRVGHRYLIPAVAIDEWIERSMSTDPFGCEGCHD